MITEEKGYNEVTVALLSEYVSSDSIWQRW